MKNKYLRFFVILLACLLPVAQVGALSSEQKKVIQSGIYYFDVKDSTNNTSCQDSVTTGGSIDRYLQAIAARESGGNPTASRPGQKASGKYQYQDATWASVAKAYYPPALQYSRAMNAPEEVQDALAYMEATVKYRTFNGDFFMVAATHEVPAAATDSSYLEKMYQGDGKTVRQHAEELVQAMQGDAGKNIPLKYSAAPDFQTALAKIGGPVEDASASTAAPVCSSGIPADGFVFYSQTDSKWAGHAFGTSDIATSGCGPTSLAMVVATLVDKSITPIETADFGTKNGGYIEGQGSSHQKMLIEGAQNWGLKVESLNSDMDRAIEILRQGGLVLAAGHGAIPFTENGHIIVIRGVTDSGKLLVGDPAHADANNKEWEPGDLLKATSFAMYGVTK